MSGPECCSNPPILCPNFGNGVVGEIAGLKAYFSGSSHCKQGILLVSDIYGFEAPNLRKIADKLAAAGFYAVVPDFLYGDPFTNDPKRPLSVWILSHGTDEATKNSKAVIAAMKNKGISAIGCVGFCWGGKSAVNLAKSQDIKAAVLCHPSYVTIDDIAEVKRPIAILDAEFDTISPPELVKKFAKILSANPEVDSYVKIFPGVGHGFTVRYKDDDEVAVKCAEEAHRELIGWFVMHVKPGRKKDMRREYALTGLLMFAFLVFYFLFLKS